MNPQRDPKFMSERHDILARGGIDNLARVYSQAIPDDIRTGCKIFSRFNAMMCRLSEHYGYPLDVCTAVFVSLSPNNDYLKNLRSTVALLDGHRRGADVDYLTVSTYNACKYRAWRYLSGVKFLDVTRGPKTRAFYQNILDPYDPQPVTVDGHMVSAWTMKRMTMLQVAWMRFPYERIAEDVRSLASSNGMVGSQMQGVLWFTWKRINSVLAPTNLDLFGDEWRLELRAEDIRPYPEKSHRAGKSTCVEQLELPLSSNYHLDMGTI